MKLCDNIEIKRALNLAAHQKFAQLAESIASKIPATSVLTNKYDNGSTIKATLKIVVTKENDQVVRNAVEEIIRDSRLYS